METKEEKLFIECSCGDHAVKIMSNAEFYSDGEMKDADRVNQEFYMSFFDATGYKPGIINRIKIAWKVLTTGKMHEDQIVMTTDEAKKLSDFIVNNTVATKEQA